MNRPSRARRKLVDVFTSAMVLSAAFLIAANVGRGWWVLALYAGGLISIAVTLGIAHIELESGERALSNAPWVSYSVFCWLCAWGFRAGGFGPPKSLR